MQLILCKQFTISEDGATTMEQLYECEQPELALTPELYREFIRLDMVCFVTNQPIARRQEKKPQDDGFASFVSGMVVGSLF